MQLRLMAVLAHPDDESLGLGGTFARYAAEGVETSLVTATRGQRGWFGPPDEYPGPQALGQLREAELRAAAQVLGIQDLTLLDYQDGELAQAPPVEIIGQIAAQIQRIRPHVVLTFDPFGVYGHPDHIAISQFAMAAVVDVARSGHTVSKFYYVVESHETLRIYEEAVGKLEMDVNGVTRGGMAWDDWAITTRVDTSAYWQQVLQAVACHRSQLPNYDDLRRLSDDHQRRLWGRNTFYRVFSLVNGGLEQDLFEGLRGA